MRRIFAEIQKPSTVVCLAALFAVTGCVRHYAPPETPLPPHTVLLSEMMRALSAEPGFTEAMLGELDKGSKKGPALLTPKLIDELRGRILGKDWSGLDRFPGWTMSEINPTVRTVGHFAGKNEKLEATSSVHPGAPTGAGAPTGNNAEKTLLDVGPYALDTSETVSLDERSALPGFTADGIVTALGAGVVRGDGPNELAAEHAESQRLADVLNRLAANGLEGVGTFAVRLLTDTIDDNQPKFHALDTVTVRTPEELMRMLDNSGHTVTVQDARYFANFGHFHYKGQDVMMPFWVATGYAIPHSGAPFVKPRPLLIPVAHAEYEWHIRGPKMNADVSYYFGIDGKSEWRTMDTLDQAWVLKRNAHTYTGADAVEVTRLTSALTVAYMHLHAAHAALPFGGYYGLGVCQDGVSAIERRMTGAVTLFPNTADAAFFIDPRDAEVNALMRAIPKDRDGTRPEPQRIFGSLPADAGPRGDYAAIVIPGLADDLRVAHAAWAEGKLRGVPTRAQELRVYAQIAAAMLLFLLLVTLAMQRRGGTRADL